MFHEVGGLRLRAAALGDGHEALLLEALHRLADDRAAHPEVRAEVALGRQRLAGRHLARDDRADQVVNDSHPEPGGRDARAVGAEERSGRRVARGPGSSGQCSERRDGRASCIGAPSVARAAVHRPPAAARRAVDRTCGPSGAAQLADPLVCVDGGLIDRDAVAGLVAEHDPAVGDLLVDRDAERATRGPAPRPRDDSGPRPRRARPRGSPSGRPGSPAGHASARHRRPAGNA